jgi:hypothetical protein
LNPWRLHSCRLGRFGGRFLGLLISPPQATIRGMTLTARVQNHTIALPPGLKVAEGTEVRVILPDEVKPAAVAGRNLWLMKYAGAIKDLPADFAAEYDHYLHGTPKRSER